MRSNHSITKHEDSSDTILRGIRRFVGEYEIPIGVVVASTEATRSPWFLSGSLGVTEKRTNEPVPERT